jgi:hypothetical protein
MDARPKKPVLPVTLLALAVAAACATGCGHSSATGRSPGRTSNAGAGGETDRDGAIGGDGNGGEPCTGAEVVVPKRLVRLSFSQIANALALLTSEVEAKQVSTTYELVDVQHRTFPPLASSLEGSVYIDRVLAVADGMARDVGQYAADNIASLTTCGDSPSEGCVNDFIANFAERAYRRPLTSDEKASLAQVTASVSAQGDPPSEALRFGVYAVLESPQFLYRTELGEDATAAGPLTPNELADALAFFLTDAPPDAPLREAARDGELATRAQLAAQAKRLLGTPLAKHNLEGALFSYFGLAGTESVVLDRPDFSVAVRSAMLHESELFLANTLWSGPLTGLLTSRRWSINAALAPLYGTGVFPPAGATPDAQGFAVIELPSNRAGLLTQAGFLTARSRPDGPSVISRGLVINAAIVCAQNPPFPTVLADAVVQANASLADRSERERARFRAETAPCSSCHTNFDPYGLALDNFDSMGAFRSVDAEQRPIDPAVTLPALVGGKAVTSAVEMAQALADSGRFEACLAERFLSWALAEAPSTDAASSIRADGCAARRIAEQFRQTDQTFEDLMIQIAVSSTLGQRLAGEEAP